MVQGSEFRVQGQGRWVGFDRVRRIGIRRMFSRPAGCVFVCVSPCLCVAVCMCVCVCMCMCTSEQWVVPLQRECQEQVLMILEEAEQTISRLIPKPYTLKPSPYAPHPTPFTLHPTPYTPHPTPHTSHPTPHTPPYTQRE